MVILKLKQCSHTHRMKNHLALQDPRMTPKGHLISVDVSREAKVYMGGSRGGDKVWTPPPLKNHKNIGLLCNTGPDLMKNHKATKPAFNVGPS